MARKGIDGVTRADTRPTCRPCQEDEHGRCATVLGEAYLGVTDSTFPCRCFHGDVDGHKTACDERQEAFEEQRGASHVRYHSPYREYERWAEEM